MEKDLRPNITSLLSARYTVSMESRENDEVFNNNDLPTYHTPTLEQDSSYKKPDREQYIFSTMGTGVYGMYSNNMILPIRQKDKLKFSYNMNKRLLSDVDKKEGRGVYIIDYYRISSLVAFDPNFLRNIINYYHNSANLYPDQLEVRDYIRDQLQLNKHENAFKQPHTILRIVTFVPEREIRKYQHVFIPTADLVIGYGYVDNNLIHPNSPLYKEKASKTTSTVKNFIEIDIIDTPVGANRYVRVGNKVVSLKATRNPDRRDRGVMTVYKDNFPIETHEATLEELEEKLGIYTTEEAARCHGDVKTAHDIIKLENDKSKIEFEKDKLLVERDKLEVSKQALEVEKDKLMKDLEKAKLEHEVILEEKEMLRTKYAHELRKMEIEVILSELKITTALTAHSLDMQKKRFEFSTLEDSYYIKRQMEFDKYQMETLKAQRDLDIQAAKAELDLSVQKHKNETAKYNSLTNIGKDILSSTALLGKIIA